MWLFLAIANMATLAALRLMQKPYYSKIKLNAFKVNWLMFMFSLPVVIVLTIAQWHNIEHLSAIFWVVLIAVIAGYYPAANYLYFNTIKTNDLSSVLPLLGTVPAVTLILGWLMLGQKPSTLGIIGVVCISMSIYILQFKRKAHWLDPFKSLATSSANRAMLAVSLITAIAAIGDKFAIARSSTLIYLSLNTIGAIVILMVCDIVTSRHRLGRTKQEIAEAFKQPWNMVIMGILLLSTQAFGFAALNVAPVAGYAIGIRNLNIVLASIVALVLLREDVNRYKLLSYSLSAAGVIMVSI